METQSKGKLWVVIAGVLLVVAIIGWFTPVLPKADSVAGNSSGAMNAEDYNPYIMYNNGYYSQKPIETTSTLTAAGLAALTSVRIGSGGSTNTLVINGSGALIYSDSQITASTTKAFDIAVTGVVSGDNVSVQLATSTVPAFGAWVLAGASASSTSGYITVQIANFTGATRNLPLQIASSTFYRVTR